MKVLAAALAVLLLVAICSLAEADLGGSSNPEEKYHQLSCCYTYISRPVPRRLITSAYWTSNSCPQPAVILVTKKGRTLCANPEALWVQKYLKDLEILEY